MIFVTHQSDGRWYWFYFDHSHGRIGRTKVEEIISLEGAWEI
jgi:hypothetical protein